MNSIDNKRFAVLIAAYNEEERISDTVIAAAQVPGVVGVLVANDASQDSTAEKAMYAGALVASKKKNSGKGSALELAAATLMKVKPFGVLDGVLLLDADVGKSAAAASMLLEPLLDDSADMVVGILPAPSGKSNAGRVMSLARKGIAEFGNGFKAQAPLSGQRALTLDCLVRVRPFSRSFCMEVDMTIRALQQGQRVVEIPVDIEHRATGRNIQSIVYRGMQYNEIHKLLNSYKK